jgi:hypothetical protein
MLDHLKANNRAWAERMVAADANFFRRLERQQSPEYLWIGCSDSRKPANEIVASTLASSSCTETSQTWPRRRTLTISPCYSSQSTC